MYRTLLRPLAFALPPPLAHSLGHAVLAPIEHFGWLRAIVRRLCAVDRPEITVEAMGLRFPSPLGLAGGFDKNGLRARALGALGFGHLEIGTVTALAQKANPSPNLFRLRADHALLNRLGFPNDGAKVVVDRLLRRNVKPTIGVPLGLSIGKSRAVSLEPIQGVVDDYVSSFKEVSRVADFVVVNISSPNTKDLRAIQGSEMARTLLGALRETNARKAKLPLLVKVAPDLTNSDLDALLDVVKGLGLAGVVATNTTISREGLKTDAAKVAALGAGGISGPPVRARALDVVQRARAKLGAQATIIGVGGIETSEHARAFLRAGATLVQMYTGFVYEGPFAPSAIARELNVEA